MASRTRTAPTRVSRFAAVLATAMIVSLFGSTAAPLSAVAQTDEYGYPTWAEVENARQSQSAKESQIAKIKGLISDLEDRVVQAQALAQQRIDEAHETEQQFLEAMARAESLDQQAQDAAETAEESRLAASAFAGAIARSGGSGNMSIELFSNPGDADDMLYRLGLMDSVTARTATMYDRAQRDANSAQALKEQAEVARDERDALNQEAQAAMDAAVAAQLAAENAVQEQMDHQGVLQAQLAVLVDDRAATEADYQAGQEYRAELERKRLEEERRKREEAERRAREEAEAQERERQRQAEEAERRRLAAEEAERRRREREAAARAAAEAHAATMARARRWTAAYAAASLARARGWEDRLIAEEARFEAEEAERLRLHQERETRALQTAARRLDGSLAVPAADARPMLADVDEGVSDDELVERATAVLPEWRRRDRLANKARAIETASVREDDEADPRANTPYIAPYNLPVREPRGRARAADRGRQLFVTLAAGLFVLAGAWGTGLLGRLGVSLPAGEGYLGAHDGLYGMGTTVLSPLFLHVLTWPLLFLLMGLFALHQWGPRQGYAARQRSTGWLVGAALLCLAAWFPAALLLPPGIAVVAWLGALAFVVAALRGYNLTTARTGGERFFTDGTVGALAGFLLAFTPTMVALSLHAWGVFVPGVPPAFWGLAGLLLAVAAAMRLALTERGRMSIALLFAGSLVWLAIPRLLPAPLGAQQTELVGLPATFAAFLVVLAAGARRYRIAQAEQELRRR